MCMYVYIYIYIYICTDINRIIISFISREHAQFEHVIKRKALQPITLILIN